MQNENNVDQIVKKHGIHCEKVEHSGGGYLHDSKDNYAYDVDGCLYCGRCHIAISQPMEKL